MKVLLSLFSAITLCSCMVPPSAERSTTRDNVAKECAVDPNAADAESEIEDVASQAEDNFLMRVGASPAPSQFGLLGSILKHQEKYWSGGIVYFRFHPQLATEKRDLFREATAIWEKGINFHLEGFGSRGRLLFVEDRQEIATNYVMVLGDQLRSSSEKGMDGGEQFLRLRRIASLRTILHELGHTLGLAHEHSRCDRNEFIEVLTENIQAKKAYNFNRWCSNYRVYYPYNTQSIMHYNDDAYSCNGKPTMRLRQDPLLRFQRQNLPHDLDFKTVAHAYLEQVFQDAPLPAQ